MITTDDNKILLVGGVTKYGYNDYYERGLGSMLELSHLTEWKEVDLPRVHALRDSHLTLMLTEAEKNLFCGEKQQIIFKTFLSSLNDLSDKKDMAELQFLNMIAMSEKLVQPELIGTFIHHATLDAIMSGMDKNVKVMVKNLKDLLLINERDILLMTQLLAMNDFSNMKLLESYDLSNDHIGMERIENCSLGLNILHKEVQEFEEPKSKSVYLKPSFCTLNESIDNQCYRYCEWQDMIYKQLTEIGTMER